MNKNDSLILDIHDLTDLGFGVAHHDGFTVFVADGVPQDRVQVKIIKRAATYAVGRVEQYLARSPVRVCGRCTQPTCRACAFRAIGYEEECRLKAEHLLTSFRKAGLTDMRLASFSPSPATLAYRNKAQYPVTRMPDGTYRIGFFAPKSHRVTEAAHCPLTPAVFGEILEEIRAYLSEYQVSTYDERQGVGLLRHIYLRRGQISGQILLTFVINGTSLPAQDVLTQRLRRHFPQLTGILLNENTEKTNVILGTRYHTLWGRDFIEDTLCDVALKLSAPAFYQVNHDAAELLYRRIADLAELSAEQTLLDLYCGVGSIGLSVAHRVKEVIGVEIVPDAVECARENARRAGISNACFYHADAVHTESLLARAQRERGQKIRPDVIVLDPPRAGCDESLIAFTAGLSPSRIVYVSCNPDTLARDLVRYRCYGYTAQQVYAFDLFPGTGHVEALVLLQRQKM